MGKISRPSKRKNICSYFSNPSVKLSISANLQMIDSYALLKTSGIGKIIGLDLLYEIENISRFPRVQDFGVLCLAYLHHIADLLNEPKSQMGKGMAHLIKRLATPIYDGYFLKQLNSF
jgi:hypothetical protein